MRATMHIQRHDTAEGWWEMVSASPDPRLKGVVLGLYQGWTEQTTLVTLRREVPRPMVPVILNLGAPWGVASGDGAMSRFDSFAAGLHDRHATTRSTGFSQCLQVNLTLHGARQVLGGALPAIANAIAPFEELLGREARDLIARLRDANDWSRRFALLDRFLLRRVDMAPSPHADVLATLADLERSNGSTGIGGLAADRGVSRKRLVQLYRAALGLPPKTIARVLRFNRALELLDADGAVSWAALAQDAGYYDQAHLARDFRNLAGCTPGAYRALHQPVEHAGSLVPL
jgi:AraC-like DNA-binding protein